MMISAATLVCLLTLLDLFHEKDQWVSCTPTSARVRKLGEIVCLCRKDDVQLQKCSGFKRASKTCKVLFNYTQ